MYIRAMMRGFSFALAMMMTALCVHTLSVESVSAQTPHTTKPATAATPATPAQQAAAMIVDGKAEDALKLIDQILAQKPGDREALTVKIDALISLDRTPEAVAVYDAYVGTAGKHDVALARHLAHAELQHLAAGDRPAVKEAAADLLKKSGETVPKAASATPSGPRQKPSASASEPLGTPSTPEQVLSNDKSSVEARIGALAQLEAPVSAPARQGVRAALTNPAPRLKMIAIDAITRLDLRDLSPDLRPLLADPVVIVNLKAAAALRQLGDHAGDEILQSALKGEFLAGRLIAARALRASGDTTSWVPAITQLLDSPRANERVLAAELLVDTDKSAAAVKILRDNLTAQDPPVRADAARVLATQAGANPWDFLPLMKDPNPAVRVQAAGVLMRALPAATAKPAVASRPAAGRRK
jgi:HEAT repeat protein